MQRARCGGDTASDRDLHTHTQMAVRTGQDTVYSPWPQDKSETAGDGVILEHLAAWADIARQTCPEKSCAALNLWHRATKAKSEGNSIATKHQLVPPLLSTIKTRTTPAG